MSRQPRLRLVDVAAHCGVSKAAVVRALNRPVERSELRPETWSRIRTEARHLGYRPDWRARALAGGRSHTIGLLYDGLYPPLHSLPGRIVAEIARWLAGHGYDLLLLPTDRDGWLTKLEDRRCDAAVVVGEVPAAVEAVDDLPLPLVAVNATTDRDLPHVMPDDEAGARLATEHLLALGHRRIAWCSGQDHGRRRRREHPSTERRLAGYRAAMAASGAATEIFARVEDLDPVLSDPRRRPTAVLAYQDGIAAQLMQTSYRLGLRLPADLSLVAFNDDPVSGMLSPPLTTLAIPVEPMGKAAADLLVDLIEGRTGGRRTILVAEELRIRESTAVPA